MEKNQLRVNGKRLQHTLEEMAKIGATPNGGVQRLALSDEDKEARDLFVKWLRELDLEIVVDEMGNIFGKRKGRTGRPQSDGRHRCRAAALRHRCRARGAYPDLTAAWRHLH